MTFRYGGMAFDLVPDGHRRWLIVEASEPSPPWGAIEYDVAGYHRPGSASRFERAEDAALAFLRANL